MDWPTAAVILGTTALGCFTWLHHVSSVARAASARAVANLSAQQIAEHLANGVSRNTEVRVRLGDDWGDPIIQVYLRDIAPEPRLPDPYPVLDVDD